jgi:hypothetical protein
MTTRANFLMFDTDFSAELMTGKIVNGKVILGETEHFVDKTPPFHLKKGLGTRPLYLMKWNSIYPMTFEVQEKKGTINFPDGTTKEIISKDLVPVSTEFYEGKAEKGYNPELLKTTSDTRFLKGMKKYSEGGGFELKGSLSKILLVVILGAGALLLLSLILPAGFKLF